MSTASKPWYATSFRRNLIDMHIPDWNPTFLSEYDPQHYVEMVRIADVDTAMIYAGSCLGICYWPTEAGHMHRGLNGRDTLGEVIAGCHDLGLNVVVYLNYWSRWAYTEHPQWRTVNAEGKGTAEYLWTPGRYGVCCPNSPYGDFVLAQVKDLCSHYDFAALWIDMIFWPTVCYCGYCRERYHREIGGDIPRVINWADPSWVQFQRKREEWLLELVSKITETAKALKPGISVGHQCASWSLGWHSGMTNGFFRQTDYVTGDFYGDPLHTSFTCKVGFNLSENRPFEFMTSRCPDLTDHTTTKPKEELAYSVYAAMTNGAAFQFIDAIDPVGTINPDTYHLMAEIFAESKRYEALIDVDAELCQDVAIYFNLESLFDPAENGQSTDERPHAQPLLKAATNIAKALIHHNIPFGVITKKNLAELAAHRVLILPNVLMLDDEEVAALTEFVAAGGGLYVSHETGLLTKTGERREDFALADLLGVHYVGNTAEDVTYLSPGELAADLFPGHSPKYPLMLKSGQTQVQVEADVEILATTTLPYSNPHDIHYFSSAISNPPGIATESPAITRRRHGNGHVIYVAGPLESVDHDVHRRVLVNLLRTISPSRYSFASTAPKPVEITLFYQRDHKRYVINLLNAQAETPMIPVFAIKVQITVGDATPIALLLQPHAEPVAYTVADGVLTFTLPRLDTYAMLTLDVV